MHLLDGRYDPITESMGFLDADFATVVAADREWRSSYGTYLGRPVHGALCTLLDSLLPLTGPLLRRLWVETRGGWTAYFDNFVLGSDTFPPLSYLAQRLKCRAVTIGCRRETAKRGAAVIFSLYGPEPTEWLNIVRTVSAVQDNGRWEWTSSGTVQPFEELNHYGRRKIRDRLTPAMLTRYAAALGIHPFDEAFYGTRGQLIDSPVAQSDVRTETLQQARIWHGLE